MTDGEVIDHGEDEDPLETTFCRALTGDPEARDHLVQRACEGCPEAKDHVARWITGALREIARREFRGHDRRPYSLTDLVQSAVWRAFKSIELLEVRTGAGFVQWARAILVNRMRDRLEHEGRREHGMGGEGGTGLSAEARTPTHAGPVEQALLHAQPEEIDRVLSPLAELDRKVVYLHVVVGLKHKEIASCLDGEWNEGSVGMRFRRARRCLREHWKGKLA